MRSPLKISPKLSKQKLNVIRGEMTVAHDDYEGGLLRRAMFKTNDNETSEDLVQTTFLKTLVYLQKGGKIDLMRSFLNHVLNDLIIDEYRRRKNQVPSLDVLLENGFEPGSSDLDRRINILDGEALVLMIPLLAEKYAVVIRLRYVEGMSLKEMSLLTGQSENTVAVQVHRGLAQLRKMYETHTLV